MIRHAETVTLPILALTTPVVLGALGSLLVPAVRLGVSFAAGPLPARSAAVAVPTEAAHTDGEDPVAPPTAPGYQLDQARTRHRGGKTDLDSSGGS